MEPFISVTGRAAPFAASNVDTDVIMPKTFLKGIDRQGLDVGVFNTLRFSDGKPNPDFILNRTGYENAKFLVAGPNFGCGSSREHAPWAIEDFGFRVIIAPSFADIFFNNCYKNGMLPIVASYAIVDKLFAECAANVGYSLGVDLPSQTVTLPSGETFTYEINATSKHNLLNGLDEIGLTLKYADAIKSYEAKHKQSQPWLFT